MLSIIGTTFSIDSIHQLSFPYIINYIASHILAVQRQSEQYTCKELFTLARLKIVPTIKDLSYPMPEHVNELTV